MNTSGIRVGKAAKRATYRISIYPDGVLTNCFEADFSPKLKRHYDTVHDLPDWVQERLAVLMVLEVGTYPSEAIPGVGRRINTHIFWIYE